MTTQRATALSTEIDGVPYIRGYAVSELMTGVSFADAIFLLLTGELPSAIAKNVFTTTLVAAMDHGPLAPSADVSRRVAAAGNPLNTAVAAGVSALGDYHGGAIEQAGRLFQEAMASESGSLEERALRLVDAALRQDKRLPGYGHRVYSDADPRVTPYYAAVRAAGLPDAYLELSLAAERILAEQKGKTIPLNIDGAMAAVLSALGLPWHILRGVFIIARTPSLVAHAWEQQRREPPVLRSTDAVQYDGPDRRKLGSS